MTPLSENTAEALLTPPADARRRPGRTAGSLARAAQGVVFLAVSLACGAGLPQEAPTAREPGASPILRQGTIHEEDLSGAARAPAPQSREAVPRGSVGTAPLTGAPAAPPAGADAGSGRDRGDGNRGDSPYPDGLYELPLLAGFDGTTLPQRRASMELVQQGRDLLRTGNYKAALGQFERAIDIDATNPYSDYFVARAHYFLQDYRQSLDFLDVSEQKLAGDDPWLAEIHVLRARNAAALGFHGKADVSYIRALSLNPGHRFALAQFTTISPLSR